MHDLVIRNGAIVDGLGAPSFGGDVAIDGPHITAVGTVDGPGRRELDADGAVVAPGWVDIHTHYDGQVSWDPVVAPSSHHGVTTVVMGNCGVGFAPARPDGHDFLIELMEGVEDIPGTALHEGIDWRWESFGEYLDALERTGRTIDVAGQVPHAAVRAYVMGERAHEDPDATEIAAIAEVVADGLRQGAVGFSTSRTILHRSRHGLVPGTTAAPAELIAIAQAMAACGRGVFQFVSDHQGGGDDQAWMAEIAGPNRRGDHLLAGPVTVRPDRVPGRARRGLRPGGGRPAHHPAGPGSADRHALRAPELVPSVHGPPVVPTAPGPSRSSVRWPRCATPTYGTV